MSDRDGPHPFRAWSLTWLTYATFYTGRKGFSVSKKTISDELGISPSVLGLIDTAYLGAYSAGQFVSGLLADRIGPRRLLTLGSFGTAAACAGFGASSTALTFGLFFFVNGVFQAAGWPGTTRSMAEWTTRENRGTVMAYWATCYQVGGVFANWFCAKLLVRWGFRWAFFGPALLLASLGAIVWLLLRDASRAPPTPGARDAVAIEHSLAMPSIGVPAESLVGSAQRAVWKSGLLWSYGASYFFIKFIRYALLFWLPYFLSRTLEYAADTAAYLSSAFEVGGVVGVIALGTLSDRVRSLSRPALSAAALALLAGALLLYTRLAPLGYVANAAGLALIGALLFGPDSLISGAAAQDAGGPHAAGAATGLVNGLGSIGSMLVGLVLPLVAARFGWNALFPMLMFLAVGAVLALIPALLRRARSPAPTEASTPPR